MDLKNIGNAASVEIVNCIKEAGLTPDETDLTQLAQAVKTMGGSGGGTPVPGGIPNLEVDVETLWPLTYRGKQVYAKLFHYGGFPVETSYTGKVHGIENAEWISVSYDYSTIKSSHSMGITHGPVLPNDNTSAIWFAWTTATHVGMYTPYNRSDFDAYLCLLYTKTTDPVIA